MKVPAYSILLSSAVSVAVGAAGIARYVNPLLKGPSLLLRRDATCSANRSCPLNACCSKYGHCGLTDDFCGAGCQNNCGPVGSPTCNGNATSNQRIVGYYESWAGGRPCQRVAPEDLNVTGCTHINYGFLLFDPATFQIASADENGTSPLTIFTDMKKDNPGLQTWVSVGGWAFNDPGVTQTVFSDMVACQTNRSKFITELMHFMNTYAFDGVDLDWEYPASPDRGGKPEDVTNYVALTKEIQRAFAGRYGLSITLPASFFYLQNFDLVELQRYVSFFNVMTYDLHGVWDNTTQGVGPYIRPHTNLTEIDAALDLLWRSKVDAQKVNLGLAWYGRSFTLQNSNCTIPNGVCKFSDAGLPGLCTKVAGTLNLAEIQDIIAQYNVTPQLDTAAAIKYISWNSTQWVAYDDVETIAMKLAFASSRCLGGAMVWAMDQADQKTACNLSRANRAVSNNATVAATRTNSTQTCELAQVSNITTCEGMARSIGNATITQFKAWNPDVVGSCDSLPVGKQVCVSPPGGWYVMAPPPLGKAAASASSSVSATSPLSASSSVAASTLSSTETLATGSSILFLSNISQLASITASSTAPCSSSTSIQSPASYAPWRNSTAQSPAVTTPIAGTQSTLPQLSTSTHTRTVTTFVTVYVPTTNARSSSLLFSFEPTTNVPTAMPLPSAWPQSSTEISSTASRSTMSTGATSETSVETVSGSQTLALLSTSSPTSTIASGSAAFAQSTPGPYGQPGIASKCNKFATAGVGDTCDGFIAKYEIKPVDFYIWNPSLGEGGKYCSTLFWAQYSYCIGVSG